MSNKKRLLKPIGLLCAMTLALSGCSNSLDALNKDVSSTLPPPAVSYRAPTGDADQEISQNVLLYVPAISGTRLAAVPQQVTLSAARHPGEAVLRQLFAFAGNEETRPLSEDVTLQLSPVSPVEISGDTATVNLGPSALSLSHSDFYVICQAVANTLTQWGDIRYVNVLVSSTQPGLDVGASVPAGCFTENLSDSLDGLTAGLSARISAADRRYSLPATLYYPAYAGRGILAETRTVSFSGRDKPNIILSLAEAMSQPSQSLSNVPGIPSIPDYLSEDPAVQEIAVTGGQRAVLRFTQNFNDALIAAGIPRSVMMAALTCTITGFVPGINGVTVYIGEELITAVVPNGIYEGAGEVISFSGGVMRRGDFSGFMLSNCTLYFGDGHGRLKTVQRPIPYYYTRSPRYLIGCLMQGPQSADSVSGTEKVLPEGLGDADLLGTGVRDNVVLLNLTQHFASSAGEFDELQERLMIYAIVNTLCALPSVRSVCFFIQGTQPDTLAGYLYLPGEFMKNQALTAD